MRNQIINIIGQITGANGEIEDNMDLELFDSGALDSLGMIEILVAIDKELGIKVQPTEIDRTEIDTPNKLIAYLENKKNNG